MFPPSCGEMLWTTHTNFVPFLTLSSIILEMSFNVFERLSGLKNSVGQWNTTTIIGTLPEKAPIEGFLLEEPVVDGAGKKS